jgi:hypothetical protein
MNKQRAIPTANVIEVVRCKDCINKRKQRNVVYCNRHGGEIFDDDYCSYGERKEQNNESDSM